MKERLSMILIFQDAIFFEDLINLSLLLNCCKDGVQMFKGNVSAQISEFSLAGVKQR